MVRSKGNVKHVRTMAHGDTMELRSTANCSPYSIVQKKKFVKLQQISTDGQHEETQSTVIVPSTCSVYTRCKYCIYCCGAFLAFVSCILLVNVFFPYPLQASCIVKWNFGSPCMYVMQKFRCQILNWSSCRNCGPHGSRCLYTLKEPKPMESNLIRAIHVAPNLRTVETIKIEFQEANKTCIATGESVSNEWLRIFDYGANYCNLHNLVTAIGFDNNPKFLELTRNAICTQYSMASCD